MVRGDMTSRQSRPIDQFGGAEGKYRAAATSPSPAGGEGCRQPTARGREANGRGDAAPGPESDDRPISVTVRRHAVDGVRYDGSGFDRLPRSPDSSRPPSSQRSLTCGSSVLPDVCAYGRQGVCNCSSQAASVDDDAGFADEPSRRRSGRRSARSEIVPLQIDRAIDGRRYLFSCSANPETRRDRRSGHTRLIDRGFPGHAVGVAIKPASPRPLPGRRSCCDDSLTSDSSDVASITSE